MHPPRLILLRTLLALFALVSLRAAEPTALLNIPSPDGARVFVDGKLHDQAVPVTLRNVPANRNVVVRIEIEGRPPIERTFKLAAGTLETWDVTLKPDEPGTPVTPPSRQESPPSRDEKTPSRGEAPARAEAPTGTAVLSILSQDGASVFIDGKLRGTAPVTLRELPAGQRLTVRLEFQGYQPMERTFQLAAGQAETWEVEMMPVHPGFEITTVPGAEVVAFDESGRRIPLGHADDKGLLGSDGKVSGATVTLEVAKQGYETAQQKVTLDLRNRVKVTVPMRARQARLQIVSVPAVSEVLINNTRQPLQRGLITVQPDIELTVEIRHEGYAPKTLKATVAKGGEQVLNFGSLDPVSGRVRVNVVTAQGPVPPEFHGKARAFVDSREVLWNRGALVPLSPGRHEITVMHDAFTIAGDGPAVVEVKENGTTEVTLRAEMKPARLQIAFEARDKAGRATRPAAVALKIDGKSVERSADGFYDVPAGRAFSAEVAADGFIAARNKFPALAPGDETTRWDAVLEWDAQAEQRKLRAAYDAEVAALLQETEAKHNTYRTWRGEFSQGDLNSGRQWVAARRQTYGDLQRRYPAFFTRNAAIDRNLTAIEKMLDTLTPKPKPPDPF